MAVKKNILLITVDQMRFDHLGLKGVKGIETPNLDRLGRDGIHFDRAYTSSPVCTPARLTLLTGQYPSSHGGYSIGVTPDPFPERTLPAILSENGYQTALIGKAHFVARPHEASHFAGKDHPPLRYFRDHTGPYAGFDFVQMATHHTTNGKPDCHYGAWMEELGVDYSEWYPDVNGLHDHSQTGVWNIPVEYHDSTWITDCTNGFIEREKDAPWFCWTSYNDPHEPFVCPEPWFSSVETDAMESFEHYREGEFDDKPPFYNEVYKSGGWPDIYWNEPDIPVPCTTPRRDLDGKERAALQATLGMVAMIDHEIGRIFKTLKNAGQLDKTLVVFTTDHGELMKHHGFWHKGLFAYDDCQRIPFLVWGAGVKPQGTSAALVNLVDLPRTFLDVAGIKVPQGMQGESLLPILSGEKETVQDATIIELQATKKIQQQTLVTDQYKMVLYRDHDWGELYDMQNDPDQYSNLWNNSDFAETKTELLQKFVQFEMKKEGHVHDRVAFG